MIDLHEYGFDNAVEFPAGLVPGRIIEQQREQYTIITGYGELTAVLKGAYYYDAEAREDFPCVGDFAAIQYNAGGVSLIAQVLPRRSKFSRADFSGHAERYVKTIQEQVVAANFDYVFILSSLNRDFKVSRIMRYLAQARGSGGIPVVILTKADLAEDAAAQIAELRSAVPDILVHAVSCYTGLGLSALTEYLQPRKTVAFLGMSGVGKSSLLNALMQREVMAVNAVRGGDSRGRHTTTHRELFMLPSGAMVIDTPGMRELGLFGAEAGLSAVFSDVEELFTRCRFNDCSHQNEPGCAVLDALDSGVLAWERWEEYLQLERENSFAENRTAYLSGKRHRNRRITMEYRKSKKTKGFAGND